MKLTLVSLMLILATVATYGEPQFYYPNYYLNYFRSGGEPNPWIPQYLPQQRQKQPSLAPLASPSVASASSSQPDPSDGRFLFWQLANPSGYTLTLSTSTATAISTVFTTCTTSTATLTTCTAGRRRRGLFYDESESTGRARRGLFYNEKEADDIFVSQEGAIEEKSAVEEKGKGSERNPRFVSDDVLSSYKEEWDNLMNREGRFLQIAIATTTTTSVTTLTVKLTAICASTTSYNVCVSQG